MNKWKNLAIVFSLFCSSSIGQTIKNINLLRQKFAAADSIILISHDITEEYAIKIIPDVDTTNALELKKWEAQYPTSPKFLTNNKLNREIIRESVHLGDSNRIKLSDILLRQVNLNYWAPAKCDMPQHSIIFIRAVASHLLTFVLAVVESTHQKTSLLTR